MLCTRRRSAYHPLSCCQLSSQGVTRVRSSQIIGLLRALAKRACTTHSRRGILEGGVFVICLAFRLVVSLSPKALAQRGGGWVGLPIGRSDDEA